MTGPPSSAAVWVDAQLPPALAHWLRQMHDVDAQHVELVERLGPPPQVVWVTCGNVRNAELRVIVLDAWPRVAELLASGEPLIEIGSRV